MYGIITALHSVAVMGYVPLTAIQYLYLYVLIVISYSSHAMYFAPLTERRNQNRPQWLSARPGLHFYLHDNFRIFQ